MRDAFGAPSELSSRFSDDNSDDAVKLVIVMKLQQNGLMPIEPHAIEGTIKGPVRDAIAPLRTGRGDNCLMSRNKAQENCPVFR